MRVAIVGGGVSGMFAAIAISKSNKYLGEKVKAPSQVILFEKNEKLGKKMFITGKGRCNLTNFCDRDEFFKNVVRNPKFLYSAYSEFSNEDMYKLVEENGCKLKIERGNRVFPISDKSYDVIDALKRAINYKIINVKLNSIVNSIKVLGDNTFELVVNKSEKYVFDKVIVATGGLSYPSTGSTGDGYRFASNLGMEIVKPKESLVPLNIEEVDECEMMQGLTLKNVVIKIYDNSFEKKEKPIYQDFGEMLFTHFGVSGPIILSASCYIEGDKEYTLSIDLKPALSLEQLDQRLLRDFSESKNKKLKSIIEDLLPKSMVNVFINRLQKIYEDFQDKNISVGDIKVSDVDKELRRKISLILKNFIFTIISKRGFDEAIITRGGVSVTEVNPKTMECKKIQGLYFAGEVLDIDALTGGFNIQIAATTGFVAGANI